MLEEDNLDTSLRDYFEISLTMRWIIYVLNLVDYFQLSLVMTDADNF